MPRLTLRLLLTAAFAACAGGSPPTTAAPNQDGAGHSDTAAAPPPPSSAIVDTVTVRVGRTITVPGSTLRVTFQRLVNDSRCGINAICVWEGDAAVAVRLEGAGQAIDTTLHTSRRIGPSTIEMGDRELQFIGVNLPPVADQPPPPPDSYEALFLARRK